MFVDGSVLEGGGQLVRNALSLAVLLNKPIVINNIRGNRSPAGLKPQHAAGINLVAQLSGATVSGATKGSCTLDFRPAHPPRGGTYLADPRTAGSTTLLLQIALPCLLFAPPSDNRGSTFTLRLRGGTNAIQAPQIDYTSTIFLPFLSKYFVPTNPPTLELRKRGFWPKGGGDILVSVAPTSDTTSQRIPSITLTDRGDTTAIHGHAYVAGLPIHIGKTMDSTATSLLTSYYPSTPVHITCTRFTPSEAFGSGSGLFLWAETSTGCRLAGRGAIGAKGKSPESVASEAVESLKSNINAGGCVDEYLQDQMIIFLALAEGESRVLTGPLTLHTKTAIWIAEQMTTAKFTIIENPESSTVTITCRGIGYVPSLAPSTHED